MTCFVNAPCVIHILNYENVYMFLWMMCCDKTSVIYPSGNNQHVRKSQRETQNM